MKIGRDQAVIYTFGDSVLDSAAYSGYGYTAPDLVSMALKRNLGRYAEDGATSKALDRQWTRAQPTTPGIAMVSIGGNDFIAGLNDLLKNSSNSWFLFGLWLRQLLIRLRACDITAYVANVYDPTFGKNDNFLGIPENQRVFFRRKYDELNEAIAWCASDNCAVLVDLHQHFLKGDPSWFVHQIEPSRKGAEEVATAFLETIR